MSKEKGQLYENSVLLDSPGGEHAAKQAGIQSGKIIQTGFVMRLNPFLASVAYRQLRIGACS